YLYAPDEALLDRQAVILGPATERCLLLGQDLRFPSLSAPLPSAEASPSSDTPLLRAYSTDGRFLGILYWSLASHAWHPQKVLNSAPEE
ncbi:MAG TPA: hypothetical protein VFU69_08750, partial [Ktedonobacterales bacterium]|nr:hypothetical protein [Ktedonobacterales bacterium]